MSSELDDLEAYVAPEPRITSAKDQRRRAHLRNVDRNARERAIMRRKAVSDKEADAIYARVLAEIRART